MRILLETHNLLHRLQKFRVLIRLCVTVQWGSKWFLWILGVLLLPEPPFLGHLLVQIPLLTFFSCHSFIVGRQSKYGPWPFIWTPKKKITVGAQSLVSELCDSEETDRADISSLLMSLRERSLLERDSLGCLYRYMTARPMPLCFRVSWLTLGSCREEKHHWISAWHCEDPTMSHQYLPPLGS